MAAGMSQDSVGADLQAGLEEIMMAGDVQKIPSKASKKLPTVN